jgi:hypothetical protein
MLSLLQILFITKELFISKLPGSFFPSHFFKVPSDMKCETGDKVLFISEGTRYREMLYCSGVMAAGLITENSVMLNGAASDELYTLKSLEKAVRQIVSFSNSR